MRGTPLDIFGYSAERRMERNLFVWFEAIIGELQLQLSDERLNKLVDIATLPRDIRGYGPVKHRAMVEVRAEMERMLATKFEFSSKRAVMSA